MKEVYDEDSGLDRINPLGKLALILFLMEARCYQIGLVVLRRAVLVVDPLDHFLWVATSNQSMETPETDKTRKTQYILSTIFPFVFKLLFFFLPCFTFVFALLSACNISSNDKTQIFGFFVLFLFHF